SRDDKSFAEFAKVVAERHPLIALVAPPTGSDGHGGLGFRLGTVRAVRRSGSTIVRSSAAVRGRGVGGGRILAGLVGGVLVLHGLDLAAEDAHRLAETPGESGKFGRAEE